MGDRDLVEILADSMLVSTQPREWRIHGQGGDEWEEEVLDLEIPFPRGEVLWVCWQVKQSVNVSSPSIKKGCLSLEIPKCYWLGGALSYSQAEYVLKKFLLIGVF